MTPAQITLITGGVRSGKSAFAERLATQSSVQGSQPRHWSEGLGHSPQSSVLYLATSRVWDDEMAARVARHQADRPASWRTVEEPLDLAGAVERQASNVLILVESIDAWVSNRLLEAHPVDSSNPDLLDRTAVATLEQSLVAEAKRLLIARRAATAPLILVTLEAGMGVVPPSPLGRAFRDLLGRVNAALAAEADSVHLMVAGLPVDVKRLSAHLAQLEPR